MIPQFYPSDPRAYVKEELEARQRRRPQYSMRAFARDLEISPSFLCEFLAGRQGLSRARALWIADKIHLNENQREHFWDLIQARFGYPEPVKKAAQLRAQERVRAADTHLSLDRFRLVADWYCFALLEILSLESGSRSLEEASRVLEVPLSELEAAVARMKNLGLISEQVGPEGRRFAARTEVTTVGEDVPNEAVRVSHRRALLAHADATIRKPFSERENFTGAFSIGQAEWPAFRRDLQKAVGDVVARYGATESRKNQVVSVTLQAMTLLDQEPET